MMIPRPREADESSAIGETDFRQSMDYGCGMVAYNSTRNDIQCGANLDFEPLYIGRERRGERGTHRILAPAYSQHEAPIHSSAQFFGSHQVAYDLPIAEGALTKALLKNEGSMFRCVISGH